MRDIGKSLRKVGSVIDLSHVGPSCTGWCADITPDIQVTLDDPWCCVRPSPRKARERAEPGRV